jgi:hypothetical protein
MVKQFFAEFGFEKISDADGQTKWRMKVDDYQPASVFIEVNTAAPELAAS